MTTQRPRSPTTTGCDQLTFNPSLFGRRPRPGRLTPRASTSICTVPQSDDPSVPPPPRSTAPTVTLPEGFSINANAVRRQVRLHRRRGAFRTGATSPPTALSSRRSGRFRVESSALPGPLPGFVYLGEPKPGERYRLLLVADGFGIHIKLPGRIIPDPVTGRSGWPSTTCRSSRSHGSTCTCSGPSAGCWRRRPGAGPIPVESRFKPWNRALPDQTRNSSSDLDSGPERRACPGQSLPFAPGFLAGVADKTAGAHAPFSSRTLLGTTASRPSPASRLRPRRGSRRP